MKSHFTYALSALLAYSASLFSIQQVTNVKIFDTIIQKNNIVLVDFFMPGCSPCMRMMNILEEIATGGEFKNVTFIKVNAVQLPKLTDRFDINSVPVIKIFKNGAEIFSKTGVISATELKKVLLNSMF